MDLFKAFKDVSFLRAYVQIPFDVIFDILGICLIYNLWLPCDRRFEKVIHSIIGVYVNRPFAALQRAW